MSAFLLAALATITVPVLGQAVSYEAQVSTGGSEPLPPPSSVVEEPRPGWFVPPDDAPTGFYFRAGGMLVDWQNDARLRDGSGTIPTDDDFGLTFAVGQRALTVPVSVEFEYAYRRLDTEDFIDPRSGLLANTRSSQHTISFNVLYDQPELLGPVGVYAGGGIGANLSEFRTTNTNGTGNTTEISGEGLFVQLMAGLTVRLDDQWQLYGGARWSDGDTFDDDFLRFDTEAISFEFGIRVFF